MPSAKSVWFFATMLLLAGALTLYIVLSAGFFSELADAGGKVADSELDRSVVQQLGTIRDHRLTEISGIALSYRCPGSFWVHNDSGNEADLFMVSENGNTLARVILKGAQNVDWEDICSFEYQDKPYICVGDVGDNLGRRDKYRLYIFEEPELNVNLTSKSEAIEVEIEDYSTIEFNYQDGPKNCEAIAFDRSLKTVFLAEKRLDRESNRKTTGIYKLLLNQKLAAGSRKSVIAAKVAETPIVNATAMDISGSGEQMVIGTYRSAAFFSRPIGTTWSEVLKQEQISRIPLPIQRQGEAICFSADGSSAIVTSELANQPIWKINIDSAFKALNPSTDEKQH